MTEKHLPRAQRPTPRKQSRRVAEELEKDPIYQKAYAKWKHVSERPVMPNCCRARTWRGVQCTAQRDKHSEFCRQHQGCLTRKKELPYGRFDASITPEQLHLRLHRAAVCDQTSGFRYYSRDKMWDQAKKIPDVHSVDDLGDDAFMECLALSLIHI